MTELWNKITPLMELSPNRIVLEKSYKYHAAERNETLQSYRVVLKIDEHITVHVLIMVGNEVYTDEVICTILENNERVYEGNLSLDELINKINEMMLK